MSAHGDQSNYPKFVGKVKLEPHPTKVGCFVLLEPIEFHMSKTEIVFVMQGTLTNGASIPWILQFALKPFHPRYIKSSIMHDGLVGEFGQPKIRAFINGVPRQLSWSESAVYFRAGMKCEGSRWLRRETYYEGVMLKKRPKHWASSIKEFFKKICR